MRQPTDLRIYLYIIVKLKSVVTKTEIYIYEYCY